MTYNTYYFHTLYTYKLLRNPNLMLLHLLPILGEKQNTEKPKKDSNQNLFQQMEYIHVSFKDQ